MLQLSVESKIYVCVPAVDFRKGIDALVSLCREQWGQDPYSGRVYVFRNRQATTLKILFWDEQGWWLCSKRLAEGKFRWWPSGGEGLSPLGAQQLQVLLWNGNPQQARFSPPWRKITPQ